MNEKIVVNSNQIITGFGNKIKKHDEQFISIKSEKLDKNGILSMANMGQDVKEAMTGGSVAVVGKNAILSENIVDKQVIPSKLDRKYCQGTESKNKFDKTDITKGYYINNADGNIVVNADYSVSNFIKVKPNEIYSFSNIFTMCFYDANKSYIVGYGSGGVNRTVPSNGAYCRFSIKNTNLDVAQMELGTTTTDYEPFTIVADVNTVSTKSLVSKSVTGDKISDYSILNNHYANKSITDNKLEKVYPYGKLGKNLLNKFTVTNGYYINYLTGELVLNNSWCVTDYIEIDYTKSYYFTNCGQMAYFNSNFEYVGGKINSNANNLTSEVKYIRTSVEVNKLDTAQIEIGTSPTFYENYKQVLPVSNLELDDSHNLIRYNTITVKLDSTGDFTNPVDAIAYINSRKDYSNINQYNIEIHEGEYDIIPYFNQDDIANVKHRGLEIPNYVNLIGIGSKENIIIKGELPATSTDEQVTTISTINYEKGGNIENITFTAKNMRYTVHADGHTMYKDYKAKIKNCVFIHFGNDSKFTWQSTSAWGSGCHSGSIREFEDCEFITYKDAFPFSVHSNVDFTKKSYTTLNNCTFVNIAGNIAFNVNSLGSGAINEVKLIGCSLSGGIKVKKSTTTAVDNFIINGYGNTSVPHEFETDGTLRQYIDFTDEVKYFINKDENIIRKGSIVKFDNINAIKIFTNNDKITMFAGIALEDIKPGEKGAIKIKGYIKLSDLGVSANLGDKIGIVNGVLTTTDINYIGVVNIEGYLKLFDCN